MILNCCIGQRTEDGTIYIVVLRRTINATTINIIPVLLHNKKTVLHGQAVRCIQFFLQAPLRRAVPRKLSALSYVASGHVGPSIHGGALLGDASQSICQEFQRFPLTFAPTWCCICASPSHFATGQSRRRRVVCRRDYSRKPHLSMHRHHVTYSRTCNMLFNIAKYFVGVLKAREMYYRERKKDHDDVGKRKQHYFDILLKVYILNTIQVHGMIVSYTASCDKTAPTGR